ncbi:MAG TPA: cellulase family glycosylhydrolase, partial [Flavisolibacter sp.]|nr:cellulase family glycosylhydrolase [Flavisolibacter sp.]
VPFAYGYRSHKALGVDLEKAIDADVYHMARLGLDAFRVHVWDVEISDSSGNLLENEHLRLFDYLLKKLKERNIKVLITPIAFWGNGYPERDEKLPGFSAVYGKGPSVVKEEAFKAQENYLVQFFSHVNPYTKLNYKDDPDVIAMEINNEPHHSGPKERTTEYVNRMAAAVKSTGWTKPIFYNISESPTYADAVVKATVNGHSFQWYPTGLVANHERKGNFLPNVDKYYIPFADTIPAFKNRAKMVYEFDAGDVAQPVMYPAMARTYRTAGFQWATQFAYDPMYTAYGNTEYQTHYLNLIYTPAKAISLLIASKAFHRLPRGKSYGTYPADTLFDVFRVSYKEGLSEMNTDEEFYYTSSTATQPKNIGKLKNIAGVGSSPVVKYEGTGAYFLEKLSNNEWKLEVMPDAIDIRDPFEKASPKKEVVKISWTKHPMRLFIPGIQEGFTILGLDKSISENSTGNQIIIGPGKHIIKQNKERGQARTDHAVESFFAPSSSVTEPAIVHQPFTQVSSAKTFIVSAKIIGIDTSERISLELRNSSNKWKTVQLQHTSGYDYKADVPADMVTPGMINYRIMVRKAAGETFTFPGGFKGDPFAWDEWRAESWQTVVAAPDTPLELFNPTMDRSTIILYNPDWRANTVEYITAGNADWLVLKAVMNKPAQGQSMGWQYFFSDKIAGRRPELSSFTKLVVRARSAQEAKAKISLITTGADAYATSVSL